MSPFTSFQSRSPFASIQPLFSFRIIINIGTINIELIYYKIEIIISYFAYNINQLYITVFTSRQHYIISKTFPLLHFKICFALICTILSFKYSQEIHSKSLAEIDTTEIDLIFNGSICFSGLYRYQCNEKLTS